MDNKINQLNLNAEEEAEFILPDECEESQKALEEINRENLKSQYEFINLITLAFIMLCAASVFIIFTSSKKFGDEGNKFSVQRLVSGEYTAEIQSRYESTVPFPEQIKWLEERISLFYGFGNKVSDPMGGTSQENDEKPNSFDEPEENRHEEKTVTTAASAEKKTETEKPKETAPAYNTTYKRTTSETTTTTSETTSATTTNNNAPQVNTTVTVPPVTTAKPTETTTKTTTVKTTTTTKTTTEQTEPTEDSSEITPEGE